jgi:tRNA(Ile)-lysidine synthase
MKKILAVSGGVDSVVLLHKFRDDKNAIIAHFNHGTRPSSDDDELFVKELAKKYSKPFFSKKELLGENLSEDAARSRRYTFLKSLAREQKAKVYTAHHSSDLIETIAINLVRGTGWRGLTPMSDNKVVRPFIRMSKKDIYRYAAKHQLTFRQDPTNTEDKYLRNRLRAKLHNLDQETREKILKLAKKQAKLRKKIDSQTRKALKEDNIYKRDFIRIIPEEVALEFLRAALAKIGKSATRPQLKLLISALKTLPPAKKYNLSRDYYIKISKDEFYL